MVMDYFYMHSNVGSTEEHKCTSIVMVNELTKERYARVSAKKGGRDSGGLGCQGHGGGAKVMGVPRWATG